MRTSLGTSVMTGLLKCEAKLYEGILSDFKTILFGLYSYFCVIPWRVNSDAGESPRSKNTAFRQQQKFEIKNIWLVDTG